jgi:hypothetical protein
MKLTTVERLEQKHSAAREVVQQAKERFKTYQEWRATLIDMWAQARAWHGTAHDITLAMQNILNMTQLELESRSTQWGDAIKKADDLYVQLELERKKAADAVRESQTPAPWQFPYC